MSKVAKFTVTLSESPTDRVSVAFRTVDLTAKSPADYTSVEGIVVFEAGETVEAISIPVNDNNGQDAKHFLVSLLS